MTETNGMQPDGDDARHCIGEGVMENVPLTAASRLDGKSSAIESYEAHFARTTNHDIRIGADLAHTGKLHAASTIKAMQLKLLEVGPGNDITVIFATGKTQWQGLTELSEMLNNWESLAPEDAQLLADCGVELSSKPDMERVFATHLDTILPQRRDAHFGYANELNHMFDKLGIENEKRLMFYGDVKDPGGDILDATQNQLSEEEFKRIEASVKSEGIKITEFQNSTLPADHIQYNYLKDATKYAEAVAAEIIRRGGGDIQQYGAGGSYEGKGHVAFNETGTPFDQEVSLQHLSHHAIVGNFKDNGGYHTAFAENGAPQFGAITLSWAELLFNENASRIAVITNKEKAENARVAIEEERSPVYQLTGLQESGPGSAIIVEPMSAENLRVTRHPWDFRDLTVEEWQAGAAKSFFIELSRQTGKALGEIVRDDFIGGKGADTDSISDQRQRNLATLDAAIDWDAFQQELRFTVEGQVIDPGDIAERLNVSQDASILHVGPHLDDLSLAMQFLIDPLAERGEIDSYYTAPGYTAVPAEYALRVLNEMTQMDVQTLQQLSLEASSDAGFYAAEKRYLQELITELQDAALNEDPADYNCWERFRPEELQLRAKLLALYLNHREGGAELFSSPEKVSAVKEVLTLCDDASTPWGKTEIELMQDIKVILRFAEEQTELMSRGVPFEGVHFPINSSWYKTDKESTLAVSDLEYMKNIICEKQPELLIFNGEGFMDHGAHSITEMTCKIAVRELLESGELQKPPTLFLYRGVWDRNEVSGDRSQVLVRLTEDLLQENDESFRRNYRSQAPNPVPDGSANGPEFFSARVDINARITKAEFDNLLGYESSSSGVLAFDTVDLEDPSEAARFFGEVDSLQSALERSREPIAQSSLKVILGDEPPYPDLSGDAGMQVVATLRAAGINPEQVFNIEKQEHEKSSLVI